MTEPARRRSVTAAQTGGQLVLIVGPSGSGKDTLMAWLRERLSNRQDVLFVRRTVTRRADAALEDHRTMSPEEFLKAEAEGRFAVTWHAHGLQYALPAAVLDHVKRGGIAIANGSRKAIGDIEREFGNVLAIHLTVEPDILRGRLQRRGRESPEEIEKRLERAKIDAKPIAEGHEIDNSGPIEEAGMKVLRLIDEYRSA